MLSLINPSNNLFYMHRELGDILNPSKRDVWDGQCVAFSPDVDVREEDDQFVFQADLPGMKREDIEVRVHAGELRISGKRSRPEEQAGRRGLLRERRHGAFQRSFRLGSGVDPQGIDAQYESGVLTIRLPKSQQAKPRVVPVSGE